MLDSVTNSGGRDRTAERQRLRRLGARLSYWIVVTFAIVVAAPWTLVNSSERMAVQNLLFDEFQRWRPRVYAEPPPIRIVEIDDESIAKLGRWPWPRARLGEMIEKITDAGAAAVALDLLLYDPGDPEDDARLAAAIQGRPVVLGEIFTNEGNAPRLPDKAGFAFAGDNPTRFAFKFRGAMTPLPAFAKAAAGVGFLNWLPDLDRVVRRVPLVLRADDKLAPSFAMEALRVAQGASSYTIKSSNGSGEASFGAHTGMVAIQNGDLIAATGPRGDFRIHFAIDDPRLRVAAWKLFEPDPDLKTFAGAIVFIGVSAQQLFDIVATPLSPEAPGVRQHAEIVGQLLMNDHLSATRLGAGRRISLHGGAVDGPGGRPAVSLDNWRRVDWLRRFDRFGLRKLVGVYAARSAARPDHALAGVGRRLCLRRGGAVRPQTRRGARDPLRLRPLCLAGGGGETRRRSLPSCGSAARSGGSR